MFGFGDNSDESIKAFEFMFLVVFAIGLVGETIYLIFQFPMIGIMLMGVSGLLFIIAKVVRRKNKVV